MDLYPESKVVPQSNSLVTGLDTTAALLTTSVRGWCIPALYSVLWWFFRTLLARTFLQKHVKIVNKMLQTTGVLCLRLQILNPLPLMTLVRMM